MFFFIKVLSALYLSITGTVKVVLIIILSIVLFREGSDISAVNAVGIIIALCAFGYNSYLTYEEKIEKDEAVKTRDDSEKEPLVGESKLPVEENEDIPIAESQMVAEEGQDIDQSPR